MRGFHSGHKHAPIRRLVATGLATVALSFLLVPAPTVRAAEPDCREVYFPVNLLETSQTMHGTLCVPAQGARTVQVLVPGGTYNSSYWDIGFEPQTRSFRQAMNRVGYATLALDRLGTGRSSKPLSALLTATAEAFSVHDVIQQLRSGVQGVRFDKVIVGGHSLGAGIAIIEAATFHDADAVLVTGMAHRINLGNTVPAFATAYPAILDPKFAGSGLDPLYITTMPDTRYSTLHRPGPFVDDAVAFDEATKDTVVHTQAVDVLLVASISPYSRLIDVPVMIVLGQDTVFCGLLATDCSSADAIKRTESLYYTAAADLHTFALQGYGHVINYAPNAPEHFTAVIEWANRKVGT